MFYVRNYSINPSYKKFLDVRGVNIESDLIDTDFVYIEDFTASLREIKKRFPGYVKSLVGINPGEWKIYDSFFKGLNPLIIPILDDITEKVIKTLIPFDQYDNILISGYPLLSSDGFDISILDKYLDFGFTNPLDFVMTLSAIKSSEVFIHNENEATWLNDGRKTIITADMHGDMQIEQLDQSETINVSHIGSVVPFKPIERKLLRCYFQSEGPLLALILGYIDQIGATKDIFGERYIKLKDSLETGEVEYGPYGNAGDFNISRASTNYFLFKSKIARFGEVPYTLPSNPVTDKGGRGYSFYIGPDKKLYVYEGVRGNQDYLMKFDLVDAEAMVKGIISNVKNGIGRTGMLELIELFNAINREGIEEEGESTL